MNEHPQQDVEELIAGGAIERSITARESSVEGATLRQLIPAPGCNRVGPFMSFEHSWPDVSDRPEGVHLALNAAAETASVSYVFHTDSKGKSPDRRDRADVHCVSCWIAIPADTGEGRPSLEHLETARVPTSNVAGVTIRVILGEALGKASDLLQNSPATLLDCALEAGADFKQPGNVQELAVYVVSGKIKIDGRKYAQGTLAVCSPGWPTTLSAESDCVVIILGGKNPRVERQSPKWDW